MSVLPWFRRGRGELDHGGAVVSREWNITLN